jgi:hypothetical protein
VSWTSEDLSAIRRAIARGEKTVQYADRSVTYRGMDELLAAEARIAADLATKATRSKQSRGVTSKGLR